MDESEAEFFNEVYREISDIVGVEAAIAIYQMYKGQQITFPTRLFNTKRVQHRVLKEYDGRNMRILAQRYGYSEKTIRRMIANAHKK